MITDPGVSRVLCHGDSNAHGTPADDPDYDDRPGCNGRDYFVPCLQTHHPLDG